MAQVDFEQLLSRSNQLLTHFDQLIAGLDTETLGRKPSEKTWSVIEVVSHLNQVYSVYFPLFQKALAKHHPEALNLGEEVTRKTTLLGKLSIYSMKPKNEKIRFKMKTFDFFEPNSSRNVDETLTLFRENHQRFRELITKISRLQVTNVKMGTSLGDKVKFYIYEAVEFLIAHEERHMVQISNIINMQTQPA